MSASPAALTLYSYWRSSAAYRVRIALELKGLHYAYRAVNLAGDTPDNWRADYLAVNPQGLVPTLEHAGLRITQSLAIIDYLDAIAPAPRLLPAEPRQRARALALAQVIACEVHPLQNPMVCDRLQQTLGAGAEQILEWRRHWIGRGLAACERLLAAVPPGDFASGTTPGVADACLVPQLYNARRYGCALDAYPRLTAIDARCAQLPAFQRAAPDVQPDAPRSG